MAEAKKPAPEKFITPRGVAVFPKLVTPDEYKGKLSYKIGVRLPVVAVQELLDKTTEKANAMVAKTKAELTAKMNAEKGAKKVALKQKIDEVKLHLPFKFDVDDEGNKQDTVVLNFKMNASYTKDGVTKDIKPTLVDGHNQVIKKMTVDIWGGSEVKVEGAFMETYVDASGSCGITYRLQAVKILVLRTGGSQHGFGGDADEGEFDSSTMADEASGDGDGAAAGEPEQF